MRLPYLLQRYENISRESRYFEHYTVSFNRPGVLWQEKYEPRALICSVASAAIQQLARSREAKHLTYDGYHTGSGESPAEGVSLSLESPLA